MIPKIEVQPEERFSLLNDKMRRRNPSEAGPCGGFSDMYACMCDYHNLPCMEDVVWVSNDMTIAVISRL